MDQEVAGNVTEAPWPFSYVITDKCYDEMILQQHYFHVPCLQYLFSKLLGYTIIIITSTLMKMPQITKILKARSGQGVSLSSQSLMLVTASINTAYAVARNYHFSLWGESIAIALQTLVICLLIIWYANNQAAVIAYTVVYLVSMIVILSPFVPLSVLITFQWLCVPLGSLSKLIQIHATYMQGSYGQLSRIYMSLSTFRTLGRLLTLVIETKDYIKILDFALKSALNMYSVGQMLYYDSKVKKHIH